MGFDHVTWLVAVSERSRQDLALAALGELDFLTYRPQFRNRIVRCGRRVYTLRALFGRYFFVFMNANWKMIHDVRGVYDILHFQESPLLVKDQVIDEIKNREIKGVIENPKKGFWKGQRVIPRSGHLFGIEGRFDKFGQRDREIAFFDILGVETPVDFEPGVLVASTRESGGQEVSLRRRKRSGRKHRSVVRSLELH